jgi:hypothetical protein
VHYTHHTLHFIIISPLQNTRVSAEGLIGVYENNGICTIVEVNSETDFVSRNVGFQEFVAKIAITANTLGVQAAGSGSSSEQGVIDISTLMTTKDVHGTTTIEAMLGDIVASIRCVLLPLITTTINTTTTTTTTTM